MGAARRSDITEVKPEEGANKKDDTYGEARRFFTLSDHELHRVVCNCHHGTSVKSSVAARIVRQIIKQHAGTGLLKWLRQKFAFA